MRRALRHPARGHADDRRGGLAGRVRDSLQLLTGQDQPGAAQLALGRETWDGVCAKCHGLAGKGDIGPPIANNRTLADPDALTALLDKGQDTPGIRGYMPPVGRGWPEFQVEALIAYIKSNERSPRRSRSRKEG